MQETIEKSPGVYVRSNEDPHELDMLWSGLRLKEDRHSWLLFLLGFVLGIALTTAVFLTVLNNPNLVENFQKLAQPVQETLKPAQEAGNTAPANASVQTPTESNRAQTYAVQSGDTLGAVAEKFYGKSTPELIEKLRRANQLNNPNDLHLGQDLVIPPAKY
jgi:LysM repeat protein